MYTFSSAQLPNPAAMLPEGVCAICILYIKGARCSFSGGAKQQPISQFPCGAVGRLSHQVFMRGPAED